MAVTVSYSLDPIILHTVLDRNLTTMLFSNEYPALLTGDDSGSVNVYKVKNVKGWAEGTGKMKKASEMEGGDSTLGPGTIEGHPHSAKETLSTEASGSTNTKDKNTILNEYRLDRKPVGEYFKSQAARIDSFIRIARKGFVE
ncbi:hypothetical protein HDU93_007144 [Gonapodya sp. JEL0774]|nr:hypothetical protein HDU93_007144 [Gonapodya sp. JEL0774]